MNHKKWINSNNSHMDFQGKKMKDQYEVTFIQRLKEEVKIF